MRRPTPPGCQRTRPPSHRLRRCAHHQTPRPFFRPAPPDPCPPQRRQPRPRAGRLRPPRQGRPGARLRLQGRPHPGPLARSLLRPRESGRPPILSLPPRRLALSSHSKRRRTPSARRAARNGHAGVIGALAAHKADLNVVSPTAGTCPLAEAVRGGHPEAVRALLQGGADPDGRPPPPPPGADSSWRRCGTALSGGVRSRPPPAASRPKPSAAAPARSTAMCLMLDHPTPLGPPRGRRARAAPTPPASPWAPKTTSTGATPPRSTAPSASPGRRGTPR